MLGLFENWMIPSTHTLSSNNEELDLDPVVHSCFPLNHGKARRVWVRKRNAIERRIESPVGKKDIQLSKRTSILLLL